MDYYALSDGAIAQLLGQRLRGLRLRNNRTQEEIASATALSLSTIKALEMGKGKLVNFISVLRELGALESLDAMIPEPGMSPLELAKRRGQARRRASGTGKRRGGSVTRSEEPW